MEQQGYDLLRILIAKTDMGLGSGDYLPLYCHLRDTVEVMKYLLDHWLPESAGQAIGLSKTELKRTAVFLAFVHDIGKATSAFQQKTIQGLPEIAERLTENGLDASTIVEPDQTDREYSHHTYAGAAILSMQEIPLWVLSVVGAHHGKTLDINADPENLLKTHRRVFFGKGGSEQPWKNVWKEVIREATEISGLQDLEELPQSMTKAGQILLTGLLITADWLASNTSLFPLITPGTEKIDNLYPERSEQGIQKIHFPPNWQPDETWRYEDLCRMRFQFDSSNAVQKAIQQAAEKIETPGLFILEAPMGIGKTEAALTAGEILAEKFREGGLGFFLPSQATSNSMFTRVCEWAGQFAGQGAGWSDRWEKLSVELAHGKAFLNDDFAELIGNADSIDDEIESDSKSGLTAHSFFLGRKTQLLADFVVGTVDQMLMGALKQKHIMLRHLGLAGKIVIIDEVHAYDAYMNQYFDCMLSWLGAYKTPVILLSATLPGKRRAELVQAYLNDPKADEYQKLIGKRGYPLLTWTDGEQVKTEEISLDKQSQNVHISRGDDRQILSLLQNRLSDGGSAGIIVNTVGRAQRIAEELKEKLPDVEILLDHAQFTMPDRIGIEREITKRLGKSGKETVQKKLVVVGTQVLEQSLDIDFDIMISDLCPMDLLLQRIGRLHRHAGRVRPDKLKDAECIVLHADGISFEPGAEAIYGKYILLKTAALLKESIRLPEDIPVLVQDTYNLETDSQLSIRDQLEPLREEHNQKAEEKRRKAKNMCIEKARKRAGRRVSTSLIDGLTNRNFDFSDAQQEAAVRDGDSSIEVLLLARDEQGMLCTVSKDEDQIHVSPSAVPSKEETKIILRQSLRLPRRFSKPYRIEAVLHELEEIRQTELGEWALSNRLGQELFLLLDENGCTVLNGTKIKYDSVYGLRCEEDKSERQGV